jgi:hypothetical protein
LQPVESVRQMSHTLSAIADFYRGEIIGPIESRSAPPLKIEGCEV